MKILVMILGYMQNLAKIIAVIFIFSVNLKAEPLGDLANDLSSQIKSTQTIRLAVLSFPYIDGFESMGSKIVQERLITTLSPNTKLLVLERAMLDKVLKEKKFEMSGLFDEETTTKLGRLLGVQFVLTGTLIDLNDRETEINARIIDAETGGIIASGKTAMLRIWKDKISIPEPIFEPTRLPKIEEVVVPKADFKIETEYTDINTLEKYDAVARYDKSDALPLEKAKKWKEFSASYPGYKDIAMRRAKEWERYGEEFKKVEELIAKKREAMAKDYQTLIRYLPLTIITPKQKSDWAEKFMENYGYGSDNTYKDEISEYLIYPCGTSSVSDIDGNVYSTILIGSQCWMGENMRVTKYPDGRNIVKGPGTPMDPYSRQDYLKWVTDRGWYSCPPSTDNKKEDCGAAGGTVKLGMLYQWSAAMNGSGSEGAQGICPPGWHVPTDAEWHTLKNYFATDTCVSTGDEWGCDPAGTALKSGGSSGFKGLLAGTRGAYGDYASRGTSTIIWASSSYEDYAWGIHLGKTEARVRRFSGKKSVGLSVRCLKD